MSKENFDYYLKLIKDTLTQRGSQYDNAFHKTWDEWGLDASRLVLTFKLNRLKNIEYNENNLSAIRDTLIDIASYCILSLIEIDREIEI